MTPQDFVDILKAAAPIIAAITGVIAVYLGRTIHQLVNSAMTAVKEDLRVANDKITSLQAVITTLVPANSVVLVPPALMVPQPAAPTKAV